MTPLACQECGQALHREDSIDACAYGNKVRVQEADLILLAMPDNAQQKSSDLEPVSIVNALRVRKSKEVCTVRELYLEGTSLQG